MIQVRVEKRSMRGSIRGHVTSLKPSVAFQANGTDHLGGSLDFFGRFGTHYIQQVVAGDALYQVLVYEASAVANDSRLVDRLDVFRSGDATGATWRQLFTPPPFYVGRLQVYYPFLSIPIHFSSFFF